MRTDIQNWTIRGDATIRDAIRIIDRAALGIVLILDDDDTLLGTITDGDVRRAILAGVPFDESCKTLMNKEPVTIGLTESKSEALELMSEYVIRHLPVVDDLRLEGMWVLQELAERTTTDLPAVVMAGGLGSRLGSLTAETPKPLISVGGKPILEHIVNHLRKSGVKDLFITTRYLADQIEEHFGEGTDFDVNIQYIRERDRLGTAGSLKFLDGQVERPFLVMNGDLITEFSVAEMLRFHKEQDASMTVAVRHYSMNVPFGVVDADQGLVNSISEKPTFDFLVNAGIYIVEPALIEHIEEGRIFDITELMDCAMAAGQRVASFPIFEQWIDVGRPEDIERADQLLKEAQQND